MIQLGRSAISRKWRQTHEARPLDLHFCSSVLAPFLWSYVKDYRCFGQTFQLMETDALLLRAGGYLPMPKCATWMVLNHFISRMIKAREKEGGRWDCSWLAPGRAEIAMQLNVHFANKRETACQNHWLGEQQSLYSNKSAPNPGSFHTKWSIVVH